MLIGTCVAPGETQRPIRKSKICKWKNRFTRDSLATLSDPATPSCQIGMLTPRSVFAVFTWKLTRLMELPLARVRLRAS